MKQKALEKMAEQDAYEYGFAQMFFGEGAGTRRKLINTVIDERVNNIPGYEAAIDAAYSKLSQVELAEKALKERKRLDAAAKAGKNLRALKSGRLNNLSTGVFIVVGGAYLLHTTGYDKIIAKEAKVQYGRAKTEYRIWKIKRRGGNVERIA